MPYYEYLCPDGHEVIERRPMSQSGDVGPLCPTCNNQTERKYSYPRWNMFVTQQEAFEWADRVMAGKEHVTPDDGVMHI